MAAIPVGISLVGTVLPGRRAGNGIALISAMLGVGSALGLPLAGVIAEHADYHVLFWICISGGTMTLAGTIALVPEPPVTGTAGSTCPANCRWRSHSPRCCFALPGQRLGLGRRQDDRPAGGLGGPAVVFVGVDDGSPRPCRHRGQPRPALLLTNIASIAGFALFAVLIGTANFVEVPPCGRVDLAPPQGRVLPLPSGLFMLALSPVSAKISALFGPEVALTLGAAVVTPGSCSGSPSSRTCGSRRRHGHHRSRTGIAYAAMPSLILRSAPPPELAAANGLNSLARTAGSSLASALGGAVLTAQTVTLAGYAYPSLAAYRTLFAICAAAALTGAVIALVIPVPRTMTAQVGGRLLRVI